MLTNVAMLQSQRDEIQNLPFVTFADKLLIYNSVISLLPIGYKFLERIFRSCELSDFKEFALLYHTYYEHEKDENSFYVFKDYEHLNKISEKFEKMCQNK